MRRRRRRGRGEEGEGGPSNPRGSRKERRRRGGQSNAQPQAHLRQPRPFRYRFTTPPPLPADDGPHPPKRYSAYPLPSKPASSSSPLPHGTAASKPTCAAPSLPAARPSDALGLGLARPANALDKRDESGLWVARQGVRQIVGNPNTDGRAGGEPPFPTWPVSSKAVSRGQRDPKGSKYEAARALPIGPAQLGQGRAPRAGRVRPPAGSARGGGGRVRILFCRREAAGQAAGRLFFHFATSYPAPATRPGAFPDRARVDRTLLSSV